MASFLEELWNSIFTPGPTPTLLVATNASFAALQLLLSILLIATHSIHFVVLSFLCGGLWYSINWFARELQAEKAKAEKEQSSGRKKKEKSPEPAGSDTETEKLSAKTAVKKKQQQQQSSTSVSATTTGSATALSPDSSGLLQPGDSTAISEDALRNRRRSLGDSSGYISTDSEWEKVSEGESKEM